MPSVRITVLALLTLLCASGALAETNIPGTSASYKAGKLFMNASNEADGKTYLAFTCKGMPVLYTKVTLGTVAELSSDSINPLKMTYGIDGGGASTVLAGHLRVNTQTRQRSSADIWDAEPLKKAFRTAKNSVTLTVRRTGDSPVSYTFPVKGFLKGMKAIHCQ